MAKRRTLREIRRDRRVQELEREGIIDNIGMLLEWQPVIGMVLRLQETDDLMERLEIGRDIVAFAIKTALHEDPYEMRSFLLFHLALDTVKKDERWQKVLKDFL